MVCQATANELQAEVLQQLMTTSSENLVTYAPCGRAKCPPVIFQRTTKPPPPGYHCDCANANAHPDCGCDQALQGNCDCANDLAEDKAEQDRLCACKKRNGKAGGPGSIRVRAITRVIDPNYRPRPPRHVKRRFVERHTEANPVPAINGEIQCRPNIARIGPGNCRRGNSMGVCATRESGCKSNEDKASTGFLAAKLTTDIDPSDAEEDCDGKISAKDAEAVSAPSKQGHVAKAIVEVLNTCTNKKKTLPAEAVQIEAPLIVDQSGNVISSQSLAALAGGAAALQSQSGSMPMSMSSLAQPGAAPIGSGSSSMAIPASMEVVAQTQASAMASMPSSAVGFAPPSSVSSSESSVSQSKLSSMVSQAVKAALHAQKSESAHSHSHSKKHHHK